VVIAVHDAARPFLPDEVLARVLTALNEGWDGAVPALPLADTIKRVRNGQIVETLPREELVAVQTPQAFLAPLLRDAVAGELAGATDCASLIERRGGRVTTVPGDSRLVKVTDAADLELVASML
jgi:2-C-methyl-D-erythritol 4-phosphate cytidylyltransferase